MQVHFDLKSQSVKIEGESPDILKILEAVRDLAPNLPNISISIDGDMNGQQKQKPDSSGSSNGVTLRQFVRKLPLKTQAEKIAAIGYFKKVHEDTGTFSPKEMSGWFTVCGFKKPNQMPVAFSDARKRNDYIESVTLGSWKITTNGENLVIGKLNDLES